MQFQIPEGTFGTGGGGLTSAAIDGSFKSQKERLEPSMPFVRGHLTTCFKSQKERLEPVPATQRASLGLSFQIPEGTFGTAALSSRGTARWMFQIPEGTFGTEPAYFGPACVGKRFQIPEGTFGTRLACSLVIVSTMGFKSQKERLEPYLSVAVAL